ncbi:MarR family winged helix-turn-helix transcriptional regulator [Desulfovibrio sp. JC022]|uniref:MarR family winged helix-turn-helix transcriptional regulator n=1 Tax=Desulfovibrio sp. JC022 TaxID=2593642 RepID=UPI0013CF4BB6|nr:MarR family winged helix-turn-helix transcriptional regulator [Desulfovibrio sp. JC022]NDV21368.1 winged helix-turn-helix transcriptional regulator [Desulfovibrio sp. JC022]
MKNADGEMLHEFFKSLYGAWKAVEGVEESIHMESGLSKAQKINLAHLITSGPMTVSDLAFARGVSRQSVQVGATVMVDQGYVRMIDNPRHKKAKLLEVTDYGRELYELSEKAENEIIKKAFPDFIADDVLTATRLLTDVRETLEKWNKE